MLAKWDSKILLLAAIKKNGFKRVFKYLLYKKNIFKRNNINLENESFSLSKESVFRKVEKKHLNKFKKEIFFCSDKSLKHEFNLLGSGWVNLNIGLGEYSGYRGAIYKSASAEITKNKSISKEYKNISWNTDYVSGYSWPTGLNFKDIKIGAKYGADIKKPWELGRFYHWAQLAFSFNLSNDKKYQVELINQFYDFTLNCPVGIGAQWGNAMEVGIRAINWVFSVDQIGVENFSKEFKKDFEKSLLDHLEYILNELEWTIIARSNHYLANLSAMIIVLSRVERSDDLENLYYWVASELNNEIRYQFHDDGGNYEGSSGYHRLSSELVLVALNALKVFYPKDLNSYNSFKKENKYSLPHFHNSNFYINEHNDLLNNIVEFMKRVEINQEQMIQVGDMDSGRVLKLTPLLDVNFEWENQLSMGPVLAFSGVNDGGYLEGEIFKEYIKINKVNSCSEIKNLSIDYFYNNKILNNKNCEEYLWESDVGLLSSLKFFTFKDFGLYIIESDNMYLSIKCGGHGQNGVGGHSHNDQLSINLRIKGTSYIQDPGSYIYTADAELRNKYRSVHAHFTPTVNGQEPRELTAQLFRLKQDYESKCLYFNGHKFLGYHKAYGKKVYRYIEINSRSLKIIDFSDGGMKVDRLPLKDGVFEMPVVFSKGYGELRV